MAQTKQPSPAPSKAPVGAEKTWSLSSTESRTAPTSTAGRQAKVGDTVAVHYTGRFPGGEVFDSSEGGDAFTFKLGEGAVIPGFEKAVLGLAPGQSRNVKVPPTDGYGAKDGELVAQLPRDSFDDDLEVGETVTLKAPEGDEFEARILETDDEHVTLDLNHPLAGETLEFDITLVRFA